MQFQKFEEFLKTKAITELTNPSAMKADRRRLIFNNTFGDRDPKEVEQAIMSSGKWKSVIDFINDPNDKKYSFLRFPGAGNWVQ